MDEIKLKTTECDKELEYIDSIISVLDTGKGRIHDKVSELKAVAGMSSCGITSSVFDSDIEELKRLLKEAKRTVEGIRYDITGYSAGVAATVTTMIPPGQYTAWYYELRALEAEKKRLEDELRKTMKAKGWPDKEIDKKLKEFKLGVDASEGDNGKRVQAYKDLIAKYKKAIKDCKQYNPTGKGTSKGTGTSDNDNGSGNNDDAPNNDTPTDNPPSNDTPADNNTPSDDTPSDNTPPDNNTPDDNEPNNDTPADNPVTPTDNTPTNNDTPSVPDTPAPEPKPVPPAPQSQPQPTPSQTPASNQSYNNYTGGGSNDVEVLTPKEEEITVEPEIIDTIEKGNTYTKIPSSTIEKVTTSSSSSGNSVIPVLAGIGAAAAAGIGAKAYMDRKKNTDNTSSDIEASEWQEELEEDDDKYKASSNNELYVNSDNGLSDDYSYQEPEVEKYESRSNSELSDMQ